MISDGSERTRQPVDRAWLLDAAKAGLPPGHGLTPLPGLNTDPSGTSRIMKVYFGARCGCGTAAVLSVEASLTKRRSDVEAAMPQLIEKLLLQRDAFRRMPCTSHRNLRTSLGAPDRNAAASERPAGSQV